MAEQGYLLIADISGYTAFVAQTELEHAHEILSELLELILARLTPPLALSKLEGDAVFVYAPAARIPRGETVIELVEATYAAFRDRQVGMHRQTTCTCNACRAIPQLDLKFIVHYGEYMLQNVAGLRELVGSDVNLVHRLLKNQVAEQTGWHGYALYSAAALAAIGVQPLGLHPCEERYEHLGAVTTHSQDLHARYAELGAARQVVLTPDETYVALEFDLPGPPALAWEWLNDPRRRNEWLTLQPHTVWTVASRPAGRTAAGARNHCAHGKGGLTIEIVLDWRPFEYVAVETQPQGQPLVLTETYTLDPVGAGTHVRYAARCKGPLPGWLLRPVFRHIMLKVFKLPELFALLARRMAQA